MTTQKKIKITSSGFTVEAVLENTPTADAIWRALPFQGQVNTWGDEIYFTIPVKATLDDTASEVVEKGALGYWPTGTAFCIFFGPTPVSKQGEIRPASKVNVFGKVQGDTAPLKSIRDGSTIIVEKAG